MKERTMTETKQPEALRLAKTLEALGDYNFNTEAAAELRRQHAEIESLRAKLDELEKQEPVAVKNHNPHLHMVGPDDGGRVSIDELSAIPIGTKLYLAAGAVEQAQESDQHRVSDCDPLLLAYFDAYARTLVKKPHKMTPEMWPEGFPFFKAGFERSVTAHARPVEPVQKLRPDFIAGYDAGMADAKRIQAAQPAPGAGDQVQMILKHRLMRKVEGDWLAASEFMTGEPDPSWLAKTEESPEEWRIEQVRRVSGEQIQAGLTRAFASWKKPAPAERTGCELGCTTECKAKAHGCASECPALPWQPKPAPAAVVGPSDLQLLKFYSVTTDAELIAAQAAHIEKLQAKLQQPPSFAPQRVREG